MVTIQKIALLIGLTLIAGCASSPIIKYRNIYITKNVPIIYVPKPPTIPVPVLYTSTLLNKPVTIGILSKAYYIDIIQLLQYSKQLQSIIRKYATLAKANPKLSSHPINIVSDNKQ